MENRNCFVSYAHADVGFVFDEILPILKQLDLGIRFDFERNYMGTNIVQSITKGINLADFMIAIYNFRSIYWNFEVGNALGRNIPIIVIINEEDNIYPDFSPAVFIRYSIRSKERFLKELRRAIVIVSENVINDSIFLLFKEEKIIGLQAGMNKSNFELELKFTSEFIELIKEILGVDKLDLIHLGKGSTESSFSIDLKPLTKLIEFFEKILFIPLEWKKRKLENLKLEIEIDKVRAKNDKIRSETRISEDKFKMEQAEKMIELLSKYQKLGLKIQLDKDVLIKVNNEGLIEIKKPLEINEINIDEL